MLVGSLGREDPLEKEMATHSTIPAWRGPRTEEPGGLQSMGSQSWTGLKQLSVHQHECHGCVTSFRFSESRSFTNLETF